jgi:hypothetical protein
VCTSALGSLPSPCHSQHLLHILGNDRGQAVLLHIFRLCAPEVLAPTNLIMQCHLHGHWSHRLCARQSATTLSEGARLLDLVRMGLQGEVMRPQMAHESSVGGSTSLIWLLANARRDIEPTARIAYGHAHLEKPASDDRSWRGVLQLQGLAVILPALQCSCWLSGLQSVVYELDEIIQTQRTEVNMLQCLGLQLSRELRDKKRKTT